jgi:hypothetical protein
MIFITYIYHVAKGYVNMLESSRELGRRSWLTRSHKRKCATPPMVRPVLGIPGAVYPPRIKF